jgi:hypothetical protein
MRSLLRVPFLALLVGAALAVAGPAAAQASFGVESFFAANCKTEEACTLKGTEEHPSEYFTQAAGHPPVGVTDFTIKHFEAGGVTYPEGFPGGSVKEIRTDVGPGQSTNPEAVEKCSVEAFTSTLVEPEKGLYLKPSCPAGSIIGENKVTTVLEVAKGVFADVPLKGTMYNLEQPKGLASYFGIALELEPIIGKPFYVHTFLEGHIEWGKEPQGTNQGDYHDVYIIKNVTPGLIESRVIFKGDIGKGGFLTLPSSCTGTGPQTTATLHVTSYEGESAVKGFSGPFGSEGCQGESGLAIPPFAPLFELKPETTQSDKPDGITTELELPHDPSPTGIDSSQLKDAKVELPEGFTMNPSAAGEVKKACTPAQARIHSSTFGTECPEESKVGTVTLTVPDLPVKEPLEGNLYLGGPEGGGPITASPYTMYLDAQSERYGVDVRLEGTVTPDPTTGKLTVTFNNNPEQPFSNVVLKFNGGELAPIANPLVCGAAKTAISLTPYTGQPAVSLFAEFPVDSNGKGGACSSPLPFSLSQSVVNQSPGYAGAKTSYTLNIGRNEGQQYLSQIKTVLPEGLVGLLPAVTKCPEPQASKGECPGTSEIGKVNVAAGSGRPYDFRGPVYLTGPYGGAPFGMSVVVPAVAGPFNLGNVVTRGTINVEPYTARVVATSNMPTIVGGIPLRLRGVSIEINKQGFLQNPTNCGVLATETTLTGIASLQPGAPTTTQTLSTPFQVNNCSALAFKPAAGAATGAKTSKANGASLETTINVPSGNVNVKSVVVQLPKQMPSRLTTLQKACPEATFASNPYHCPSGSFVGGARANTPALSAKMTGPAILVSHGGRAFPDLDLLLEAEGVKVILVGNTQIKNGITTTTFAAPPDVPVTSITVNLPTGAHSALAANGNLCASKLVLPTTIVGQNGSTFKQNTTIKVRNCPVAVVGHKTAGNTAYLTVQTYEAGRISGKGSDLGTTFRTLKQAQKAASLKVSLSSAGRGRGRPFSTKIRVGFVPKKKGQPTSVTYVTVRFG